MSLSGITRSSYEDNRFTDEQLLKFRGLFKLSVGSTEDIAEFKIQAVKLERKVELPLFMAYKKDATAFVIECKRKIEESSARAAAHLESARQHQEQVDKIDTRLAALELQQKAVITQYASSMADKVQEIVQNASSSNTNSKKSTFTY